MTAADSSVVAEAFHVRELLVVVVMAGLDPAIHVFAS